jgi:hypothetical protein
MQPTEGEVEAFLEGIPNPRRREDARVLVALLSELTQEPPQLWAAGIVGFGRYRYRYPSGREGDAPLAGFAPRAAHLVVYLIGGFADRHGRLLERLGPHTTGKSCLYVNASPTSTSTYYANSSAGQSSCTAAKTEPAPARSHRRP